MNVVLTSYRFGLCLHETGPTKTEAYTTRFTAGTLCPSSSTGERFQIAPYIFIIEEFSVGIVVNENCGMLDVAMGCCLPRAGKCSTHGTNDSYQTKKWKGSEL